MAVLVVFSDYFSSSRPPVEVSFERLSFGIYFTFESAEFFRSQLNALDMLISAVLFI